MGLFKRKESRANTIGSQLHGKPQYDPQGRHTFSTEKVSDYSLKSPTLTTTFSSVRSTMTVSVDIDLPPAPDPKKHPAQYLRSIYAVRERSKVVLAQAKKNHLNHFDVDLSKFQETADYVVAIIKVREARFVNA